MEYLLVVDGVQEDWLHRLHQVTGHVHRLWGSLSHMQIEVWTVGSGDVPGVAYGT